MTNIAREERVRWLGASEVAALFGVSPFITRFELWHQKKGHIPPADLDDNERVLAGQFLEPAIAAWAARKWEWDVAPYKQYLRHNLVAQMGASLDCVTGEGEPVEIKNVDTAVFREQWTSEGDTLVDAPLCYLLQVQHQLACLDTPERGWLVACVGGNKLYRMEVPRHGAIITKIEWAVEDFWADVHQDREPAPDFQADADAIARLYRGVGAECIDLTGNPHLSDLCGDYRDALGQEKAAEIRKIAALAEIKRHLQDARSARVSGGYWVKASLIPESTYTVTRKAYHRFTITHKPEQDL